MFVHLQTHGGYRFLAGPQNKTANEFGHAVVRSDIRLAGRRQHSVLHRHHPISLHRATRVHLQYRSQARRMPRRR
jgi:hypothetical protein